MISGISWRNISPYPVLFGLLALLWGGSFVAIEVGLEALPPLLFAAMRYDIAALVVVAYALATADRVRPRTPDDWLAVGTVGVLIVACYQTFLFLGSQHVHGAVAAIVVSLSPVVTAGVASVLVPGEGLHRSQYAGVALGFLGVLLVVDPTGATGASMLGAGLVLAGVACFALGSVLVRPLSPSLPTRSVQAWAMIVGAVLLHLGSLARGETLPATLSPTTLAAVAYLGVAAGALAFLVYFTLLSRVGAAELNLVAYLEPVVATALSWVLLGTRLDPLAVAGFGAIFAGFAAIKHDRTLGVLRAGARSARRVAAA